MSQKTGTTIREEIAELKRELEMRKVVYDAQVKNLKLSRKDADHRIACIVSTIGRLEELERQRAGEQAALFASG